MQKYKGFIRMSLIFLIVSCCCGCGNGMASVNAGITDVNSSGVYTINMVSTDVEIYRM